MRLGSRAPAAAELAALADASRSLPGVGRSWRGRRYYDVALGREAAILCRVELELSQSRVSEEMILSSRA